MDEEELRKIISFDTPLPRLEKAKDMFLFGCFTGLSYIDIKTLSPEHFENDNTGRIWIKKRRVKQKNGKDFITNIKIATGGNSPILINNKDCWFETCLNEYLHQYLGVSNLEEAQKELDIIYGNKKVGNKMIAPIQSLYIWGTYQLLQNTHLKSTKEKVPTRPQANLIESYLRAIELINTDDVTTDANNIRSRLNSFLKKYDTVEALLDYKTFKSSPYNIGGTKLW